MIKLEEHGTIVSVLEKASSQNERVCVVLEGGKEYTGKVKKLKDDQFCAISEISGREFFDVIFRIDKIVAVEVKAR
jgi:small nuclear ribonucleoprotein (snRNP)-like protein